MLLKRQLPLVSSRATGFYKIGKGGV